MIEFVREVAVSLAGVFAEAGLWLLLGFGVAGLLHVFVSRAWLSRHLGKPGFGSVLKGTAVGIPMPLCSCAVIPAAASLRRSGASKGASASFAVSTPEIDVPAFSLTWALLGPVMAVARVIGAAVSAIVAGLLIDAVADDDRQHQYEASEPRNVTAGRTVSLGLAHSAEVPESIAPASPTSSAEPADCCQHAPETSRAATGSLGGKLLEAARYGFIDLPADLAKWLTVGLLLSAVIDVALPPQLLAGPLGSGTLGILAAMGLGLFVYVCATGSTPLAAALVAKGLGPGAALAFLLAGPATNPATMAWVYKDLGRRALIAYLIAIGVVAFAAGFLLQWLAAGVWMPSSAPLGEGGMGSALGGALLAAVMTYALVKPLTDRLTGVGSGTEEAGTKPCCSHSTSG